MIETIVIGLCSAIVGGVSVITVVRKGMRSESTCDTLRKAYQDSINTRFEDLKDEIRQIHTKQGVALEQLGVITGYLKKGSGL